MSDILSFLREFRSSSEESPTRKAESESVEHILSMSIPEFAEENLAILVRSTLLGENFYLVSNRRCLNMIDEAVPVYLPEELVAISDLPDATIKHIHNLKKKFEGEILVRPSTRYSV